MACQKSERWWIVDGEDASGDANDGNLDTSFNELHALDTVGPVHVGNPNSEAIPVP